MFESAMGHRLNGLEETASTFLESVMAVHTVTRINENATDNVVESDSKDTEHKLELPSKFVVQLEFDTRTDIAHVLADLRILTTTDVDAIVKNRLSQ